MGAALRPSGSEQGHHSPVAGTQTLALRAAADLGDITHPCCTCVFSSTKWRTVAPTSWGRGVHQENLSMSGSHWACLLFPGTVAGASGKSCCAPPLGPSHPWGKLERFPLCPL